MNRAPWMRAFLAAVLIALALGGGCGGGQAAYVPAAVASAEYEVRAEPTPPSAAQDPLFAAAIEGARGAGREVTPDGRLEAVAQDLLAYLARFGRLPDSSGLDFFMRHRGLTEPLPLVYTSRGPAATAQVDVRTNLRSAAASRAFNRVGVARQGDQVIVLLALSYVELRPFPRRVGPGTLLAIEGALRAPFQAPRLVITDPVGQTHELPAAVTGRRFSARLPLASSGAYQIEIIGEAGEGTTVLANFPVYSGQDPPAVAPAPASGPGLGDAPPANAAQAERELLALSNQERGRGGLPALVGLPALADAARAHSRDMAEHGFVAHLSKTTGQPADRVRRIGIRSGLVLENVARADSAHEAHTELMRSPGHRAAILNREVTHVGIGVVLHREDNRTALFVTQKFVRLEPAVDVVAARAELLRRINARRAAVGARALEADGDLSDLASRGAARFFRERADQQDVVDGINADLEPFGLVYRRVAVLFSVVSNIEQAAALEPLLDRGMRTVGIGVGQGDRADLGARTLCAIFVLTWPR